MTLSNYAIGLIIPKYYWNFRECLRQARGWSLQQWLLRGGRWAIFCRGAIPHWPFCWSAHSERSHKGTLESRVLLLGAGIAQWLEHRTRDWKVAGSNPCWNGGRIFFSRVDFLCWLLFRYPFHPRVTTVARKKSRSFCQKVQVAGYS